MGQRWHHLCHRRTRQQFTTGSSDRKFSSVGRSIGILLMSVAYAIETDQLRKVFGDYAAVKSLTLQVIQGEVFSFLGPNGVVKTTSIKMLLGLITPSSGSASLLGKPVGTRDSMSRIGFLPEHFRFQEWL